jgi:enoyl-CoA hydratase
MAYKHLICEELEAVAIITLNRPEKRNALSIALREELVRCLDDLGKKKDVKAVVLTGAGPSFCAGFDLKEFAEGNTEKILTDAVAYHREVYTFAKPLIAAVNGPALAGGMDLALMCDMRMASKGVTFGQPQVSMGIPAAYNLIRTVLPEPTARELCLTGRQMDVKEALNLGLISKILPGEKLIDQALKTAQVVAGNKASLATKEQFIKEQPRLFESGY